MIQPGVCVHSDSSLAGRGTVTKVEMGRCVKQQVKKGRRKEPDLGGIEARGVRSPEVERHAGSEGRK